MLGTRIGPYQVIRRVGGGGMGEVYEAVHVVTEGRAAIKVLLPEYSNDPEIRERFINEARAVNVIKHPGIVRVEDCGQTTAGLLYLTMEYLDGESLEQRLAANGGALTAAVAMPIIHQIAEALAAAHQRGIIHRDLKPSNVMLVPDSIGPGGERVKVLDFGIAKVPRSGGVATQTGALLGTFAYMSPEQCRGESTVDGKADVYALGIMLYEALAGARPFQAENNLALLFKHVSSEPPALQGRVPRSSAALALLALAMLRKQSAQRPDMAEIAEATHSASKLDAAIKRLAKDSISPVSRPSAAGRVLLVSTAIILLPILIATWWAIHSREQSKSPIKHIDGAVVINPKNASGDLPTAEPLDLAVPVRSDLAYVAKEAAAPATQVAKERPRPVVHTSSDKPKPRPASSGSLGNLAEPLRPKSSQRSPEEIRKMLERINSK